MKGSFFIALLSVMFLGVSIITDPLVGSPTCAADQIDGDPVSIGTFKQLHSDFLDEDRLLLVCTPRDYEKSSMSYPVLFVLYGGQIRGYFAEAVHIVDRLSEEGSIPKMIIVGIANVDRYRDLSPIGRRDNPSGIEPFSRFFAEELVPYIEGAYRTKDYRLLVGPQAGAAFGLYNLAKRQGLFDAFIIENPFRSQAVYEVLMPLMEGLADEGLPSFTFLQIASHDRTGFLDRVEELEYMRTFEKLVADQNPHNLKLITHIIEKNEDFIPTLQLKDGLRELFREYRFPESREISGLADILTHYAPLSERFGFEVDVPEMTLYAIAEELKERGAIGPAKEVLDYLIEVYPSSVNGHWGLGNLHREQGNRELALECYRNCLKIMPNMPPARYWIEKLEDEQ